MIHLLALHPDDGAARAESRLDLESGEATARLCCLPGTTDLHVALADGDGRLLLRAEVEATGGEDVVVHVRRDAGGAVWVEAGTRRVWELPPEDRYAPMPVLTPDADGPLDLLLLLDATARTYVEAKDQPQQPAGGTAELPIARTLPPLWATETARGEHVDLLTALIAGLAERQPDLQVGVMAFADDPPPEAAASDLRPDFRLHPADGRRNLLRRYDPDALRGALEAVKASSGGDFVDALGDALADCGRLHWRDGARRIVVLSGDSPGLSLLDPPPRGADALVRSWDVDLAVRRLHRRGVEVVTLYHDAAEQSRLALGFQDALLRHARRQYERLASQPAYAHVLSTYDAEAALRDLTAPPPRLARGSSLGVMVEGTGGE